MAGKRSNVWQHFRTSDDNKKTECQLCKSSLAYSGSTSAMRNHMKLVHKRSNLDDSGPSMRQTSLVAWQKSRQALGKGKYERINKSLAMMCALDLRSISIVDGTGFQRFVHELNPNYQVPSRKTVSHYVGMIYDEQKQMVQAQMRGCPVALTTDMWTSVASDPYMTVTAHFITDSWVLQSCVLMTRATTDRHTGENIASHLNDVKQEFGICEVSALVTDNATNMVAAASEAGMPRVPCFSHTLQLAVNDGLKITAAARAIAAGRRVVAHFSHSAMSTQALKEHQSRMGSSKPLSLIQDVATRWNSSYFMLKRLLELRIPLYATIFDERVTKVGDRVKLDIKDADWAVMELLVPILEPLAEATELLTKEDRPTASSVYMLLSHLLRGLVVSEGASATERGVKEAIATGLRKRFKVDIAGIPEECGTLLLCAALDPRYKSLRWLPADKREEVTSELVVQADKDAPAPPKKIKTEPGTDASTSSVRSSLMQCLQGDVIDLTVTPLTDDHGDKSPTEMLVADYIKAPVNTSNSLDWWRAHENEFPQLAPLARRYLAIPATEVPSERVFSSAGMTITKLRASLDPESVDKLIFLNKNYKLVAPIPPPAATTSICDAPAMQVKDEPPIEVVTGGTDTKSPPRLPMLPTIAAARSDSD